MNGSCFEIAKVIHKNHPRSSLMFIGADSGDRSIQDALDVGALAYLIKQEPPDAVVTAIGEIASGRAVFSGPVATMILTDGHGNRGSCISDRVLPADFTVGQEGLGEDLTEAWVAEVEAERILYARLAVRSSARSEPAHVSTPTVGFS